MLVARKCGRANHATPVTCFACRDFEFCANLFAQPGRSGLVKLGMLERGAEGLGRPESCRAFAASFQMALEIGGAHGVEFAVKISVKERP
jgi:hypothetical protein